MLSISAISAVRASQGAIELVGKEWNHDPLKVYVKASSDLSLQVSIVLNDWSSALEAASGRNVDNSELGRSLPDGVFDFVIVSSSKEADIIISVERGAAAGLLGMTLLQDKNGDGYFDKAKITVKAGRGLDVADFRNVMRHEIGHALGLGHAEDPSDLMHPTYDASATKTDIYPSNLDVCALRSIYLDDGFGGDNLPPQLIPSTYSST
ncbi:MAG: matrixin family metalloprotease [Fervidicoccaceae archaeon]